MLGLVVHPKMPWLGASPDGVCVDKNLLIEIKCLIPTDSVDFASALAKVNYLKYDTLEQKYKLKEKHKYYAQIQLGMLLLDMQYCDFVIVKVKLS